MKGWKNLPVVLLVMFVIDVVSGIAFVAYDVGHAATDGSVRIMLAASATSFVTYVLGVAGFFELANRAAGRIAVGFRITAFGFALALGLQVWWHIFQILQPQWGFETISAVHTWTHFGVALVPLLGVIVAASGADGRAAIAGVVVLLVTDPVPPLAKHMYGWIAPSWKSQMVLFEVIRLGALVAILAIAARLVVRGAPAQRREEAYGLRTVSSALWLRVIAACGVAGLTLMFALGRPGEGAVSVLKLATFGSAIAGAISFAMVARGALGARTTDMPGELLVLAAAGSLWCLGVTLAQLPYTYRLLYGGGGYSGFAYDAESTRDLAGALSIVTPLVAICAIGLVARAIAGFAARRGLEQLRVEAQNKGLGFVTLMLAALGFQQWLLPSAESESSLMFLLVAAAACSLWATVLMARLCTLAADSLAVEPGLPTATLRT